MVSCPTFRACHSFGVTLDEAMNNIREVIELCLEEHAEEPISNNIFVGVRDIEVAKKHLSIPTFSSLSGKEMVKFLASIGFVAVRVRGLHHRLRYVDGRRYNDCCAWKYTIAYRHNAQNNSPQHGACFRQLSSDVERVQ